MFVVSVEDDELWIVKHPTAQIFTYSSPLSYQAKNEDVICNLKNMAILYKQSQRI
jgi:hypothetical protein